MLSIDEANLVAIKEYGQKAYPEECCGVLLGKIFQDGSRKVTELWPLENRSEGSRNNRFLIEAEDIRQAEQYGRENGLEILGFYHSHPDCDARPSQFDLEQAWPWYHYIIISIKRGYPDSLTCWQLNDDRSRFQAVEICLNTSEICISKEEKSDAQ